MKAKGSMERVNDSKRSSPDRPLVTVIMPIRDEAGFIKESLGAVLAQDYGQNLIEVIVSDGMSTDGTREVVGSFQAAHPNLKMIDNPGLIAPTGLNAALRESNGEIIIRVDGHCVIAPDYVSRCVDHLLHDGVDGVGGPIETVGETFCSAAIALAMSSSFGVGGAAFRTVKDRAMFVDTVAFPAYTRLAIENAGMYDEELVRNQDDEYNYRLRGLGRKILLTPDINSRYYSRSSIATLWRQYFQYGFWKVRVMQKHIGQMRLRQFAPPLFVTFLLASSLLGTVFPPSRWAFASVLSLYAIANLVASALVAREGGVRSLPLMPLIFAVLHFSYGLGFLAGLGKFWDRWGDHAAVLPVRARGA